MEKNSGQAMFGNSTGVVGKDLGKALFFNPVP